VTSRLGEFSIGTGDTIFYSMLPALAFYQFNLTYALYTLVAVDVGVVITLYLLSRSRLLPGLPIPMALGLGTLLLLIFV
jgi:C4-dicarboxylate transporter